MDIEILLALQQFRTGSGAVLADFFSKMTFLFPWCMVHLEKKLYLDGSIEQEAE